MGVDVDKCIGCNRCVEACKTENHVPDEPFFFRTWIERYTIRADGEVTVELGATVDGVWVNQAALEANLSNWKVWQREYIVSVPHHARCGCLGGPWHTGKPYRLGFFQRKYLRIDLGFDLGGHAPTSGLQRFVGARPMASDHAAGFAWRFAWRSSGFGGFG
jgi:ferredoxin